MNNQISHIIPIKKIDETAKWYAIYTLHRNEKAVVEKLKKKNLHAYIPLIEKVKRYTRKIKRYEVPLINNYVFVHITSQDFAKVYETEHVIKFIKKDNKPHAIPSHEIEILKRIEGNVADVEVEPTEYQIGDAVEIAQGNLTGLKGKLVEKKGKKKFTIELDHLGLTLLLDIEINMLQKIQERRVATL